MKLNRIFRMKFLKREVGSAMVEFSIVVPILMLLSAGVVDLGSYLHKQYTVSRAAYEGVRFAASQFNLSSAGPQTSTNVATAAAIDSGHALIRSKIVNALREQGEFGYTDNAVSNHLKVTSQLRRDNSQAPQIKSVTVTVELPFRPLLPLLASITKVSATEQGPYLCP